MQGMCGAVTCRGSETPLSTECHHPGDAVHLDGRGALLPSRFAGRLLETPAGLARLHALGLLVLGLGRRVLEADDLVQQHPARAVGLIANAPALAIERTPALVTVPVGIVGDDRTVPPGFGR